MKRIILLVLIVVLTMNCFGQEENVRSIRKFGFGSTTMGPTMFLSVNLNYFITHNFNIEIGGGLIGYYGGIKYYVGQSDESQKWAPYFGIYYTSVTIFSSGSGFLSLSSEVNNGFYIPIGIQLMTTKGFTFAPEIAYFNIDNNQKTHIWGALKFGYNF